MLGKTGTYAFSQKEVDKLNVGRIESPKSVMLCVASLLFRLLSATLELLFSSSLTTMRSRNVSGIVAGIETVVCKGKLPPTGILVLVLTVCKKVSLAKKETGTSAGKTSLLLVFETT